MLDGVRTDLLGDAAGFACGDVGTPNSIEQGGFAVIDVAEHRYDGWARRHHFGAIFFLFDRNLFAGFFNDRVEPEFLCDGSGDVSGNILVDRRHRTHLDEFGNNVFRGHDHRGCEFLHRQKIGNLDRLKFFPGIDRRTLALLFPRPFFFEQQIFFAIFFRGRFLLVAALVTGAATR